jgi:methyltransferase-like protein/SAM-dependent methyltransferase
MDALTSHEALLQETIDRVAAQYDDLPYGSNPFAKSHPSRLAATAHLFGLETPPVENARVLELGCASGGNLIPHAAYLPDARFVGIDIGKRQVAEGKERIERLGLKNVEIHRMSITDVDEDLGEFDYIISHGIYSWVPEPVRDALLRVSCNNLSPGGVVYVSYNVLPGWRLNQPMRDACNQLVPGHLPPRTRVQMARELFEFFKTHAFDNGPFSSILREFPARVAEFSDDYIFHEYMEDTNFPTTFSDFMACAEGNGLCYLGDAEAHMMFPDNFSPNLGQAIHERTTGDVLTTEQMIDFLSGRAFRQTLLVRSEHAGAIKSSVTPDRMEGLHFVGQAGMALEATGNRVKLTEPRGRVMNSTEPAVGHAMERLLAAFPSTITLDECAANMTPQQRGAVADALLRLTVSGMITVSSIPLVAGRAGNRPLASHLARGDATFGLDRTANRRHEAVQIDPAGMVLIPALDGKTDRKALEKLLYDAAQAGTIAFRKEGRAETDPQKLRQAVHQLLPSILDGIAASGILES